MQHNYLSRNLSATRPRALYRNKNNDQHQLEIPGYTYK